VGKAVYHVQTEDRGQANPVIRTTVYAGGRVLAKRATSYRDFLASPDFNESTLQVMVERQHQELIEDIRQGRLPELVQTAGASPGGISVQLLNASTFLVGTTAQLRVGVTDRESRRPLRATVQALLQAGSVQPVELAVETNPDGIAEIQLPLPRLGPGGAQLIIRAAAGGQQDEIRYSFRRKA
jgi:hypothetical protein